VVVFHDAIAERFPALVFPSRVARCAWGAKTLLARKMARSVLTVSEAAKREIVAYLGISAERIEVITEGAGEAFRPVASAERRRAVRAEYGIPAEARILIYVGGFAPHKNLERLLEAFARIADAENCRDLWLVMVGDPAGAGFHSNYEQLTARVRATGALHGRVRFTGYVPDEALAALYSDALALVLPSLSEGFGLPALEAMCCGTPVLGARGGAVIEVAGGAGLAFDPLQVGELADTIVTLASRPELAARLGERAIHESRRHGWDRGAELAIAALERAADR
jgi:glycosyltransferase involved in cell wall biosynthesis